MIENNTKPTNTVEEKYKALFMSSKDAIMTLKPPLWKFTDANPATLKMFQAKSNEEFEASEPWKLSPEKQPDGRPSSEKAKEMIDIAMHDGSIFFDWVHTRLNGESFPATVLLTKVGLNGDSFLQATVRDITEQKKNEVLINKKIVDLERLSQNMVGRELKMVELKKEIEALKAELENK